MPIRVLPCALRQTQTFAHGKGSLERLYNFINKALSPSAKQCEREEKAPLKAEPREHEDKERLEAERRRREEQDRLEHVPQSQFLSQVTESISPADKPFRRDREGG